MIEAPGFNCSLAPWNAVSCLQSHRLTADVVQCDLSGDTSQRSGWEKMHEWENVFLEDARDRLNGMITGYEFSIRDLAAMVSDQTHCIADWTDHCHRWILAHTK